MTVVACPETRIYTLSHPLTGEVRYVGKTIQTLGSRLSAHMCRKRNEKHLHRNKLEAWVESLRRQSLAPVIELLSIVSGDEWEQEEKFYISYFRFLGLRLVNHSSGGDRSNFGCRWKRSGSTQEKLTVVFSSRERDLSILDSSGKFVRKIKNFYEAQELLGLPKERIHRAYSSKSLIDGRFYIVKTGTTIVGKIKIARVKIISPSGEESRFRYTKDAARFLGMDNSTLSKALKSGKDLITGHKIQYDDSLSF